MSSKLEFPYIFRRDNFYPIIQATLRRGTSRIRVDALVDSGASISVFQGSIAESLGINAERGKRRIFQGVGGKIIGYVHNVMLKVNGHEFLCRIAFSYELTTSLNLLGRDNFFKQYVVTFDEKKRKLRLTKFRGKK